MKKEQIVTTVIMLMLSIILLIGFTIAWYSSDDSIPRSFGMKMKAEGSSEFKIALTPGGTDIAELSGDEADAEIIVTPDADVIAPGTSGKISFYLTPKSSVISTCTVLSMIQLQEKGQTEWYPDYTVETPESTLNQDQRTNMEIAESHIAFFHDESKTQKITQENPLEVSWRSGDMGEKEVIVYWQWYYNTPDEMIKSIEQYDEEDDQFGQQIEKIRFWFKFMKG